MTIKQLSIPICLFLAVSSLSPAAEYEDFIQPLLQQHCAKCHGDKEVNGEVNFREITSQVRFLENAALIEEIIAVLDAGDMPPEDEPQLAENDRAKLLAMLKTLLEQATAGQEAKPVQMRRLNRFQYNNAVRDLFQLNRDLFPLPEKLMTRHEAYLREKPMPARVNVASHALNPAEGMQGVKAFPKDLRASHGFDNQANQLTLSPLLLDSYLRLSVSIVESPDFNEQTVGIWNEFFEEPAADVDRKAEVRRRLEPFLKLAFRKPVEEETLDRYTALSLAKMDQGLSFTESMKKGASAALSSPLFLFRSEYADEKQNGYELASRLSFFLWASGPDAELLQLAENEELARPEILNITIERMLADPKIERFLDTFPAQWMQLENVLAATPDPQAHRLFSLEENHPASLQMVLEPLLLFDAVFIEDRPVIELVSPQFSYQSDFLKTWYTTNLQPPPVDEQKLLEINAKRTSLEAKMLRDQAELEELFQSVRARLLADRQQNSGDKKLVDLRPYAAWEFNGDLTEAIRGLDLTPHGDIQFDNGSVVLKQSYLQSKNLPIALGPKSLEVWCKLPDVNQLGGGVMGVQDQNAFDTIVLGERMAQRWMAGSEAFKRTLDIPDAPPEEKPNELLHLVMVYQQDGTISLYRNGQLYGKPYRTGLFTFPKDKSFVLFGLRHLPPGGNRHLNVTIDRARLYDRGLTAEEITAAFSGQSVYIVEQEIQQAFSPEQKGKQESLNKSINESAAALSGLPKSQSLEELRQVVQEKYDDEIRAKLRSRVFERMEAADPRYGGVITNGAMLSMTSGPDRTHPIARGAWIIEVIFNDPPDPPPNDVPPLNEDASDENQTIREKFAQHRSNAACASCHARLDPLGFALENYDITGRWRDKYENGREVDSSGTLLRKYEFAGAVEFKQSLVKEEKRFAKAFTGHLLRYAVARELRPADSLVVEKIVATAKQEDFKLRSLIREVIRSESFLSN